MTSLSGFIVPSALVSDIPYSSIAVATCAVGLLRRTNVLLSAVPASLPFMPLLAISPSATDMSSILYPIAPAMGATYLKLSPSMPTFVFELVVAAASTSAKCALSAAVSPNAVSASVTMSDTVPRSSPDAAARLIMPGRPSIISCASQPAMPMYSMALAASVAPNTLSAPICMAACRSMSISSDVAPAIAPTRLIWLSNSMPVFSAPEASCKSGFVTYSVSVEPT